MKSCLALLAALLLWAPAAGATAKVETELSGFLHQVTLRRDTTQIRIRQWVAPFRVRLPFAGGALEAHSALMVLQQNASAETAVPLDTSISGRWDLWGRGLLTLRASLPTGRQNLAADRADLARTLARNDLDFPVKFFGQGLDLGAALSWVRQAGHRSFSLGLAYLRKGSYNPFQGVSAYKPGDEASLALGLDDTWNRWVFRLSGVGTFYFTDRLHGLAIFQNGKQLLLQAGLHYLGPSVRLGAELTEIARFKNRILTSGRVLYESRDSNGNDLRLDLSAAWTPNPAFTLSAEGQLKHLTPNAYPPGDPLHQGRARVWGGGGGLTLHPTRNVRLSLRAFRWEGSAEDRTLLFTALNFRAALAFLF